MGFAFFERAARRIRIRRHLREHLVGWQRPIHRYCVTVSSRANRAKRPRLPASLPPLGFAAGNQSAATQVVALFVQGTPFAELVETLQRRQLRRGLSARYVRTRL